MTTFTLTSGQPATDPFSVTELTTITVAILDGALPNGTLCHVEVQEDPGGSYSHFGKALNTPTSVFNLQLNAGVYRIRWVGNIDPSDTCKVLVTPFTAV